MRIGVFADSHDHLDNVRLAVGEFNKEQCDLVVCTGDFVSTFVTPPLRRLRCPFLGCFGDNDGNKRGLLNGVSLIGTIGEPPFGFKTPDGTKVLVTHMLRHLRGLGDNADLILFAHTHKPVIKWDQRGRLFVNPGETSGWSFRKPTIAIVDTQPLQARLIYLPEPPPVPKISGDVYSARLSGRGARERTD